MKAIICNRYGGPEVLTITEVPKPTPKSNELLVKVVATSVNSGDVRVRGLAVKGFLKVVMRIVLGFNKPRKPILGNAFSGIVEEVGSDVTKFKKGDEVFGSTGFKFGTNAEYMVIKENSTVSLKPQNASFNEAAAIVFGGQTAIHFLKKAGIEQLKNPQVLIIGATGAVGSAAIQIAQHYTATLVAVCSTKGIDLVKKLGVTNIILYDEGGLDTYSGKYDIILDAVGVTTRKQCKPLLKKEGIYKTVGGLETSSETVAQLQLLKSWFEQGHYQAVIDRIFPFEEVIAAHSYVDTGRKKGNVILQIQSP